jgi:hypothetical protein
MEGDYVGRAGTEVGEGSREPEGEGGEGFHIAQTGRRLGLLAPERGALLFQKQSVRKVQFVACSPCAHVVFQVARRGHLKQ